MQRADTFAVSVSRRIGFGPVSTMSRRVSKNDVSRGREISGQDFGASFLRAVEAYPAVGRSLSTWPTTVQKRNRWVVENRYRRAVAKNKWGETPQTRSSDFSCTRRRFYSCGLGRFLNIEVLYICLGTKPTSKDRR